MLRIVLVSVLLASVPSFAAAHGPCPHGADAATAVGSFYLTGDGRLYQESGEHAGLQREAGSCPPDDENGRPGGSWSSDTRLV